MADMNPLPPSPQLVGNASVESTTPSSNPSLEAKKSVDDEQKAQLVQQQSSELVKSDAFKLEDDVSSMIAEDDVSSMIAEDDEWERPNLASLQHHGSDDEKVADPDFKPRPQLQQFNSYEAQHPKLEEHYSLDSLEKMELARDGKNDVQQQSTYQGMTTEEMLKAKFGDIKPQFAQQESIDSTLSASNSLVENKDPSVEELRAAYLHLVSDFSDVPILLTGSYAALEYGGTRNAHDLDCMSTPDGLAAIKDKFDEGDLKFDGKSSSDGSELIHMETGVGLDIGDSSRYMNVDENGKIPGESYEDGINLASRELMIAVSLCRHDESKDDTAQIQAMMADRDDAYEKGDFDELIAPKIKPDNREAAKNYWNSFFK